MQKGLRKYWEWAELEAALLVAEHGLRGGDGCHRAGVQLQLATHVAASPQAASPLATSPLATSTSSNQYP